MGTRSRRTLVVLSVLAVLALGCGGEPAVITSCEPADGVTPICGFHNPEDLAPLPRGSWIVVSQFPGLRGGGVGSLVGFRPADGRKLVLFPEANAAGPDRGAAPDSEGRWGSDDCPGAPDPVHFGPHGIDVDRVNHRLAVVNHGEREAVELFEVGHSPRGPSLVWRGCVPLPDDVLANDVALLPDGSFVVTNMMPRGGASQLLSLFKLVVGGNTGNVLEWSADAGLRPVPESEGSAPNGIAVSHDGRDLYFAEWAGRRLVALRRNESGEVTKRRSIDLPHHPDNITWTRNGELLVTGQVGRIGELLACGETEGGTCALAFSVIEVGSGTLDTRVVLEHPGTAQGAGTVALEVGGDLLIGTFDGDRIGRATLQR